MKTTKERFEKEFTEEREWSWGMETEMKFKIKPADLLNFIESEKAIQREEDEPIMNAKLQKTMMWIAEYAYRKANPDSKMDVPSIVYEQVARDFGKFWDTLTPNHNG